MTNEHSTLSPTLYNYFRDYDPAVGRYSQSDPIGLNGGIHTYAYVGASPLRYQDRFGLDRYAGQSCYRWDAPDDPLYGPRKGRPFVTLPWPFAGDPRPDYVPEPGYAGSYWGEKRPSCAWVWRPPRRCELPCFVLASAICGTATSGMAFPYGQVTGKGCHSAIAAQCEKSCGEPPPCTSGNDFSYGAP